MNESGVIQLRPRRPRPSERVLLKAGEAAERLRVDVSTIRRWTRADRIPHVHLGDGPRGPIRYSVDALDDWWRRRQEGSQ